MNIGRQWEDRLRIWAEEFPRHYFRPQGTLEMEYFTTMEHLAFGEAAKGPFRFVAAGEKWGKKWEYGWFRTRLTIPAALEGQRVVFTLNTAEEMLVWVNGAEAGAIDKKHRYITLTAQAKAGTVYRIVAECYAGHGVRNEGAGIVPVGVDSVPEPPENQVTVGKSWYGAWNEPLFQAAIDYLTLYSLVKKLPDKSLRAMKIIDGLKKFTYIADFELPEPELTESVKEAAKALKPLLECHNGSTAPEFTVFGQSHLDMAWLWPVEETVRKCARTYSNQLALMEEYPEYRFFLCEPPILENLKKYYPGVWSRVREKMAQFIPEGAMWIESDTNIPSGESLIRQFLWGRKWFQEELGADSRLAWMPDTFGFSAALPQIMKKCGVDYFATQKLVRQDPEADPFPCNLFWWEGLDGSRVLSHLFKKNNAVFQAGDLITRWEEDRIQTENIDGMIYPYGYGDGGGGPTREMVETVRRCTDLEGAPRCRVESPVEYMKRGEKTENVYCGELYLAWHRGTLTTQAETKRMLRKAEIALKQTEYLLSRQILEGKKPNGETAQKLHGLWEKLLYNQFHDVAAGVSLERVHQRAVEELEAVVAGCEEIRAELGGEALHNPHGWPISWQGQEIPAQGWCLPEKTCCTRAAARETAAGFVLENGKLRCEIDRMGQLVSLTMADSSREFLSAPGNRLEMFKDVNTCYDAWELGSMYENLPVELDAPTEVRLIGREDGVAVEVKRLLHHSPMTQRIFLGHRSDRLDFETEIHWQERHKMLKAAFPVNVYTREALHEIQFGYVKRPTHRSRQHDKDQYEVCNHRYTALTDGGCGAAVLNDGKYGVSTRENEISLTLLKAPMMPDQNADRGIHRFTYSFCPFEGSHVTAVRQGYELNEPPVWGPVGCCAPVLVTDRDGIIVETVQPLENAVLVRCYEALGRAVDAMLTVHPNVKAIRETDMAGEQGTALRGAEVSFGPFEIKTFVLEV